MDHGIQRLLAALPPDSLQRLHFKYRVSPYSHQPRVDPVTGVDFNMITLRHFTKLEEVELSAGSRDISMYLERMQHILSSWVPQETQAKTRRLHFGYSYFSCNLPHHLNVLEKYAELFERQAELGE